MLVVDIKKAPTLKLIMEENDRKLSFKKGALGFLRRFFLLFNNVSIFMLELKMKSIHSKRSCWKEENF